MEGYNPSTGCTMRCSGGCRGSGWVPAPRSFYPRRDPFMDAVGRMDNPCERPARCPPGCQPVPKFRLPKEQPFCDINNYLPEQYRAKVEECLAKQCQRCCPCRPCPGEPQCPEVTILDPNYPVICQQEQLPPPEYIFHLREQPCRSNLIAGFFNPDDNRTKEENIRASCDRFYMSCGSKLKPYPCRGVIQYPPRRWVSEAEEASTCYPSICEGSKFITPEYIQQKEEELLMMERQQQIEQNGQPSQSQPQQQFRGCTTGRCGSD